MATDKTEERLRKMEKAVQDLRTELERVDRRYNDEIGKINDVFKDSKKYIDEANKSQDEHRKYIDKRLNDEIGKMNDVFKSAKKYIDESNKSQDSIFKKLDDRIKGIEKLSKKK